MSSVWFVSFVSFLTMMQGNPPSPDKMQRVNAATSLWVACAEGNSGKLAVSSLPLELIADETFRICADIEPVMAAEMKSVGMRPEFQIEQLKRGFRMRIQENIGPVRTLLELPR